MSTIVNTPPAQSDNNSGGTSFIVGAIVLFLLVLFFFLYGVPALRNTGSTNTVNVPDKVQVDVNGSTTK